MAQPLDKQVAVDPPVAAACADCLSRRTFHQQRQHPLARKYHHGSGVVAFCIHCTDNRHGLPSFPGCNLTHLFLTALSKYLSGCVHCRQATFIYIPDAVSCELIIYLQFVFQNAEEPVHLSTVESNCSRHARCFRLALRNLRMPLQETQLPFIASRLLIAIEFVI